MTSIPVDKPLTDAEFDRLGDFLDDIGGEAMTLEELDGFFCALISGPDTISPSEYLPEVFGGDLGDSFATLEEADEILALLLRRWNTIATALAAGEIHNPIIFENEDGIMKGNDWAHGFLRGADLHHGTWREIFNEERGGNILPMLMLEHEDDPDPELRCPPIPPEKREGLIVDMIAGMMRCYRYFRQHRQAGGAAFAATQRRAAAKIGRNQPCSCGSGRKYKHCCGGVTVQ